MDMKRTGMLVAAWLVMAGCDGDDTSEQQDQNGACQASEQDDERCAGDVVQKCNGSLWVVEEDCAATGLICKELPNDPIAVCKQVSPPKVEGEACTGAGQGDCEAGLSCIDLNGMPIGPTCYRTCDPSATATTQCVTGELCVSASEAATDGVCFAISRAQVLFPCVGVGQGSCLDGLSCLNGICGKACTPADPVECGGNEYCESDPELLVLVGVTEVQGICITGSGRDEFCLSNEGCPASNSGTYECRPTQTGIAQECKLTCDPADIGVAGTAAGCLADEGCLPGPFVELEQVGEIDKSCDEGDVGTTGACDGSNGYGCRVVVSEAGQKAMCSRNLAYCGAAVPLQTRFGTDDLDAGALDTADKLCEVPGRHGYCEVLAVGDGTSTADVHCVRLGSFFYGEMPCDILSPFGQLLCAVQGFYGFESLECFAISSTEGRCGYAAKACVAYCESLLGGAQVCPTSDPALECIEPDDYTEPKTHESMGMIFQGAPLTACSAADPAVCGSGTVCLPSSSGFCYATCTEDGDCDQVDADHPFRCLGNGTKVCARNRKVCMAPQ